MKRLLFLFTTVVMLLLSVTDVEAQKMSYARSVFRKSPAPIISPIIKGVLASNLRLTPPVINNGNRILPGTKPEQVDYKLKASYARLKSTITAMTSTSLFSNGISYKISERKPVIERRFVAYAGMESQSVDDPNPESFPITNGQKEIATYIYNEIKSFGGKTVKTVLSDDYYIYVDIPSNIKGNVPSVLFMAHMDVTPEAPGKGVKPQVHRNYDGGAIQLGNGVELSPDMPEGAQLKYMKGMTIITSDGSTLLGADDKAGCTVLVTMIEDLIKNPKFKHGRVMVMFSQNEDVGKAAYRYDPSVFGAKPDIVIDVDGDDSCGFSVENFTAIGMTFHFKGNMAHPRHGLENKYGDALTASSYFIGSLPPFVHPSASFGKKGYIHCYSCEHPKDSTGKEIRDEYIAKIRLRYFDKNEGETLRRYLDSAFEKTKRFFPFVKVTRSEPVLQYENIAYSMPKYVPELITTAASKIFKRLTPRYERGGTTSAMLSARMPDKIPGGPCIFSGQHAEHSVYEWCCVEEMTMMVNIVENIISGVTEMKFK